MKLKRTVKNLLSSILLVIIGSISLTSCSKDKEPEILGYYNDYIEYIYDTSVKIKVTEALQNVTSEKMPTKDDEIQVPISDIPENMRQEKLSLHFGIITIQPGLINANVYHNAWKAHIKVTEH